MLFVWSQLSVAAISTLSSPFFLFTLSQKIKQHITHSSNHSTKNTSEKERGETDRECAFESHHLFVIDLIELGELVSQVEQGYGLQ